MRLQPAASQYSTTDQNLMRETIGREDDRNMKTDKDMIIPNNIRIVLTSPNGTKYALSASNAGALTLVAYP
jgi:hypothetical protein